MKPFDMLMTAAALTGLSIGDITEPSPVDTVFWVDVCGRPGMRVAIELGGDGPPEGPGDCAEACHAALCRKTIDTIKNADGEGAAV